MAKKKDTQIVPTEVLEEMQKVDTESVMDKVALLADMLTYVVIDEEKSVVGQEPFYCPVFEKHEQSMIKKKLWSLIERL